MFSEDVSLRGARVNNRGAAVDSEKIKRGMRVETIPGGVICDCQITHAHPWLGVGYVCEAKWHRCWLWQTPGVLTVLMRANPGWQGVLLLNRPPDSPSWGFFGSSRGGGRINLLQERELPVHHTSDFSLINNCALSAFSGKLEMGTGGEFECNYLGDELVNNGLFCFHDMSSCLLGKENVQNTHLGFYFSSDFCSGL